MEAHKIFDDMTPSVFFAIFGLEKPVKPFVEWSESLQKIVLSDLSNVIKNPLPDWNTPSGDISTQILAKAEKIAQKPRYHQGLF